MRMLGARLQYSTSLGKSPNEDAWERLQYRTSLGKAPNEDAWGKTSHAGWHEASLLGYAVFLVHVQGHRFG